MGKDRKIVGIWPESHEPAVTQSLMPAAQRHSAPGSPADQPVAIGPEVSETEAAEIAGSTQEELWLYPEETELPRRHWPWVSIMLGIASLAWIGFVAWLATDGATRIPNVVDMPSLVLQASAPIALLLLIQLLLGRVSAGSIARHAEMLAQIQEGHARMQASLAQTDRNWRDAQAALDAKAAGITVNLVDAALRIESITQSLDMRMRDVVHNGGVVAQECDAAHRAMLGVIQSMPKAEEVSRRAAENMRIAGQTAYQFGGQLEARLAAIQTEAAATEQTLTKVDSNLAERLEALVAATGAAEQGAIAAGERFSATLANQRDAALATLADLAASMETSVSSAEMRLETARVTMRQASEAQIAALDEGMTRNAERSAALTATLSNAVETSKTIDTTLVNAMDRCNEKVAALESEVAGRLSTLTEGFGGLQHHGEQVTRALEESAVKAAQLGGNSAQLMDELRALSTHVGDELPQTLRELSERLEQVHSAAENLKGQLRGEASGAAESILSSLHRSDELIADHATSMRAMSEMGDVAHGALCRQIAALESAVERVSGRISELNDAVGPALAGSLNASENAAEQAASRIRLSMSGIVESSSTELSDALDTSLKQVVSDKIVEQLNQIAVTADNAVSAANAASDRLMRQLITIAETTKTLEARASELETGIANDGRQVMARRMSLISEALQSTAVDITRLLSIDVADQSWTAYLRGDRGIFSRRAVRLLTSAEARDILKRYQEDEEFRGHVNLYIHEFEDMLRAVMETREGDAISVTLLSSDVGKIYVALAQAIERLRG